MIKLEKIALSNLLLELYCEDIPALAQNSINDMVQKFFEKEFQIISSGHKIKTWCNLNRIGVYIENINIIAQSKKGPSLSHPAEIIDEFRKKYDEIYTKTINGKEYYFTNISPDITSVIQKLFLVKIYKKTLKWPGSNNIEWVTPIRNILYLYGDELFDIVGLKSSHKTIIKGDMVEVKSYSEYSYLLNNMCLAYKDRLRNITDELSKIEIRNNISIITSIKQIEESINLNIHPSVYVSSLPEGIVEGLDEEGRIDKGLLLPPELIQMTLEKNHKFILFKSKENNNISPIFVVITERGLKYPDVVISDYRSAASARLKDAMHLLELDCESNFFNKKDGLKKIYINKTIGSMYDQVERMLYVFDAVSFNVQDLVKDSIKTIISLYKLDLGSEVVQEFPELQGVMGGFFARKYNYSNQIVDSISLQYTADDSILELNIVKVLEYLDTLVGMFYYGVKPTSSKDPYALKRKADQVIRLVVKHDLKLMSIIKVVYDSYKIDYDIHSKDVFEYLKARVYQVYKDYPYIKTFNLKFDDLASVVSGAGTLGVKEFNMINSVYKRITSLTKPVEIDDLGKGNIVLNSKIFYIENVNVASLYNLSIIVGEYIDNNSIKESRSRQGDLYFVKTRYFDKLFNFS